ncbi:MAG: hypothetical protein HY788_18160 [Deltaproteobacteria bacterium]|nr:hypothetical protein [Deltaproteobacteria bacterium]
MEAVVTKEKTRSRNRRPARNLRYLLCDPTGEAGEPSSSDVDRVFSPIRCLDKAVDENPRMILVRFGRMPIRERETMVELCFALKRNTHTRDCPVLVLLSSMHRGLMEDLNRSGVDFVKCIGGAALNSSQLREIVGGLGPDDCPERQLSALCDFLHYTPIDGQREITVCGAYLERLVLGGRWLHEVCETENHLQCEYYMNPRVK